ncbi:alpha-ketoglutarate-dependent dioxygenase alkB homolog 3 isoform X6 [Notamacropus eugenii]|uniref:alpha-ketoglutarate-dependent dioxygenase alkB homolog 3 isoform X6 n=1 Tax=Notamacropus eugenii TaxID=9315 RepID=UPI003B676AA8
MGMAVTGARPGGRGQAPARCVPREKGAERGRGRARAWTTRGAGSACRAAGPGWPRPAAARSRREGRRFRPEGSLCTENRRHRKEGVYEISTSPTGISRIRLFPNFIESKEADWIFEQLCQDIPWKQRTGIREGISYLQPRLTAWYGELPYTYSRITMEPNPQWHPVLTMLKKRIEENTGHTFNSLLCNLYRNDKDSIDWHSDDEPSLGRCPVIASLSLGATRVFEMRKKPPPEENGDYTYVEKVKIPLDHGTLLMMEGATQADWQHRVPKEYHSKEARANLTFRTVFSEPSGMDSRVT